MRLAAYAGASTVLAAGVIIRAFHQRPNFYSACVYLAQSNACLMILTNLVLLTISGFVLGLQRLLYGPLRPIEVEMLYENAWYAITETCLAMTIFREEVGAWFIMMFVTLLVGKVWGWIGAGRVEVLQQQPPANPRLFHARISISLLLSVVYNLYMLYYSVSTVLDQARPNMMVMFAFEFAVQAINSMATVAHYGLAVVEIIVVRKQTQARLRERRAQIREDREEALTQAVENGADSTDITRRLQNLPDEDETDVDAMDVDVPGWENKSRWVFYLDLAADFFKLVTYLSFFAILTMFYGLPIHILRDVFVTLRSFLGRIRDFIRYRNATRDMNDRYPDATADDLARDNVCIICREEMMPWQVPNEGRRAGEGGLRSARRVNTTLDERLRPKKLPCGHILHFACLRSWLARQQVCPTCRRPVLEPNQVRVVPANRPAAAEPHVQQPRANVQAQQGAQPPPGVQNAPGGRIINLGPLRIGFGVGPPDVVQNLAQQMNNRPAAQPQIQPANAAERPRFGFGLNFGRPAPPRAQNPAANFNPGLVQAQLHQIEQQIMQEINSLRLLSDQLHNVRALQGELARLRIAQAFPPTTFANPNPSMNYVGNPIRPAQQYTLPSHPRGGLQAYGAQPQTTVMAHNDPNLPQGLHLPPGWTMLPLSRVILPTPVPQIAGSNDPNQRPTAPSPVPRAGSAPPSTQAEHTVLPTFDSTTAFNGAPSGTADVPVSTAPSPGPFAPVTSTESPSSLRNDDPSAGNQASPSLTASEPNETPRPADAAPGITNAGNEGGDHGSSAPLSHETVATAGPISGPDSVETPVSHAQETRIHPDESAGDGPSDEGGDNTKGKGRAATVEDLVEDTD
ncbi:hypothetical protein L228DRAFT_59795 [Xylona heveae TC161]|uniref:RING-type E3 ubiquitin transferase n=1 Tax=Xylona heveae (strain CBS 132557 / TC161) TaxID=1328760 RepID=A0A165IJP3_XYLHT|nr:hypothetical protein L228DRAFT_59795 [Xylona heveae TC161]KZF24990.1 hypothetical protein L228DRAFT_59795 [Xylona heveae TC161]